MEIPQSVKNAIPENKTHFLSDSILDSIVLNEIYSIKPILESSETYSVSNFTKCNDESTNTHQDLITNNDNQSINDSQELIINNYDQSTRNVQEAIINNDDESTSNLQEVINKDVHVSINENPQEKQIISKSSNEFSVEKTKTIDIVQSIDTIEPMDVENKLDAGVVHQATIDEDLENDAKVEKMFNDFIDDF